MFDMEKEFWKGFRVRVKKELITIQYLLVVIVVLLFIHLLLP